MAQTIYVIEDDENIRTLIRIALQSSGYQVLDFETAEEALAMLGDICPDLAVFDIMLPEMDGLTAVREIRKQQKFSELPIMMLTAKDTEVDKVVGLDGGADDYMTKPFGVLELTARIRSLLRRSAFSGNVEEHNLQVRGLSINTDTREVMQNGTALELTFKEYELLLYLIQNHHKVISRDELLDKIWGVNFVSETRTLDMHIRTLRQKLGSEEYIKTMRGVGYRFLME